MRCSRSCAPRARTWPRTRRTWRAWADSAGSPILRATGSSCGRPPEAGRSSAPVGAGQLDVELHVEPVAVAGVAGLAELERTAVLVVDHALLHEQGSALADAEQRGVVGAGRLGPEAGAAHRRDVAAVD